MSFKMLYGAKWVADMAECDEGRAWGLAFVKNGAKELAEALAGFERADWLLWYLIRAGVLSIPMAYDFIWSISLERINDIDARASFYAIEDEARVSQAAVTASSDANIAMQLGHFGVGHELIAVSFLARMKMKMLDADFDGAIKDAQCVINNLVAAKTGSLLPGPASRVQHVALCDYLRDRVIVKAGS